MRTIALIYSIFQTCVCANRILVQEGIHDKFVAAYQKAIEKIKVADGFADGCTQGPMINERAVEKVDFLYNHSLKKKKICQLSIQLRLKER